MHTDSGMTGISLSGFMPYMTVASLEMSDEPDKQLNNKTTKPHTGYASLSVVLSFHFSCRLVIFFQSSLYHEEKVT